MTENKSTVAGRGRGRPRGAINADQLSNGFSNMAVSSSSNSVANGHYQGAHGPSTSTSTTQHLSEFQRLMERQRPEILNAQRTDNPLFDGLINEFKNLVYDLSLDPTLFDIHVPCFVENLYLATSIPKSLPSAIATTLVKWAIASESFRYTGSQLANYLALPDQVPFDFTKVFFECVTTECYDNLDNLINCVKPEEYRQLEGVMLFLAELYLNMGIVTLDSTRQQIESIKRIDFIKDTLKRAILKILEKAASDSPLETAGKVLKLTGAALEEQSQTKEDKEITDIIFLHVKTLSEEDYLSSKVKSLFKRVLLLRQNHWESPDSTNFANVNPNDSFTDYDVPVFYLTDGTAIPAHEADFDDGTEMRSSDRMMYLHGEGDVPDSRVNSSDMQFGGNLITAHTLTAEEEEAFNLFLSQMS